MCGPNKWRMESDHVFYLRGPATSAENLTIYERKYSEGLTPSILYRILIDVYTSILGLCCETQSNDHC